MSDPKQPPLHDLLIVGGGPSALSAAIYTTREDIGTTILEKGVVGGLAAITDSVENYPGFPDGITGMELSERLRAQAEKFGTKIELAEVMAIKDEGDVKVVRTSDGDKKARAVLIATGNDYRKAGFKGEDQFYGLGVHFCATCDGPLYKDRNLAVIGGGNSAAQESLFLARLAKQVDIFIRKDKWRASDVLVKRIEAAPNIKVHFNSEIIEATGQDKLISQVDVKNSQTNTTTSLKVDGVFVFVGLIPNTQFLNGSGVELDERGFVITDGHLATNLRGIFCSGDVRSGATEQIASAVGEGATAALAIREYLDKNPARKHIDDKHHSTKSPAL